MELFCDEIIMHIFTFGAHGLAHTCTRARAVHLAYIGAHPQHSRTAMAFYIERLHTTSARALLPHMRHMVDYARLLSFACRQVLVNLFKEIIATGFIPTQACARICLDNAIHSGNTTIAHWFLLQNAVPTLTEGCHPLNPQLAKMLIKFQHVRVLPQFYSIFINSAWLDWFEIVDSALMHPEVSLLSILHMILLRPNFMLCVYAYKNKITQTEYDDLISLSVHHGIMLQL